MSTVIKNSNKRIAKNTLFLYIRLVFTLFIGLYASRLILDTLGVVDYGIYNIVGGVVATLSFLHSSLSGATTRFINIHMNDNPVKLNIIFNTAKTMHILLAIIVFIFAETLGLWFVYNKLNIPDARFSVALVVYQISVISVLVSIIQVPYDATIIAHERMNVYAVFSILQAILNLAAIIVLEYLPYDKLLSYSCLILIISVFTRFAVQNYCRHNFKESKFNFLFDRKVFKEMTSFFGWDLYGNMSVILRVQGINVLQNMFFGPIINASVAIVNQAQNGVLSLGNNLALAAKPQIIQSYSRENFERMFSLLSQGTRLSFYLVLIASLPLVFNTKYILQLWLGQIPDYADTFLKLSLLSSIISMSFMLLIPVIHATGKVFAISFLTGSIYLLSVPITYLLFQLGFNPIAPYYINFFVVIFSGLMNLFIVQKYISNFSVLRFFLTVLLRLYTVFLLSLILSFLITNYLDIHPFLSIIATIFTTFIVILSIGLKAEERYHILVFIKHKIENKL